MYFFPLHHVSENDILSQRVLIHHETQGSQKSFTQLHKCKFNTVK
jgi:hypothetical protein